MARQSSRSAKRLIVVAVCMVVVLIGILGYLHHQRTTLASQTPSAMVRELAISIPQAYPGTSTKINTNSTMALAHTAPGFSFVSIVTSGSADVLFTAADTAATAKVQPAIKQHLLDNNYQLVAPPDTGFNSSFTFYARANGDACELISPVQTLHQVELICATGVQFVRVAQAAQPFALAQAAALAIDISHADSGAPTVATTREGTYQYATARTLIAEGYYYRKLGETAWHYYKESQEGLTCAQLITLDAQHAFADICNPSNFY